MSRCPPRRGARPAAREDEQHRQALPRAASHSHRGQGTVHCPDPSLALPWAGSGWVGAWRAGAIPVPSSRSTNRAVAPAQLQVPAGGGKGCQEPSPSCSNAPGSGTNYSLGPGIGTLQRQNDFKNLEWDQFLLKLSPADPAPSLGAGRGGCRAAAQGAGPFEGSKTLAHTRQLRAKVTERCWCSLPASEAFFSLPAEALQSSALAEQ